MLYNCCTGMDKQIFNRYLQGNFKKAGSSIYLFGRYMEIYDLGVHIALSYIASIEELHEPVLENLGAVYPTFFCQCRHPCRK